MRCQLLISPVPELPLHVNLTVVYIIFRCLIQVCHGRVLQGNRQGSTASRSLDQRARRFRRCQYRGSLNSRSVHRSAITFIRMALHLSTNRHALDPPQRSFVEAFHAGSLALGAWWPGLIALNAAVATCPAWIAYCLHLDMA